MSIGEFYQDAELGVVLDAYTVFHTIHKDNLRAGIRQLADGKSTSHNIHLDGRIDITWRGITFYQVWIYYNYPLQFDRSAQDYLKAMDPHLVDSESSLKVLTNESMLVQQAEFTVQFTNPTVLNVAGLSRVSTAVRFLNQNRTEWITLADVTVPQFQLAKGRQTMYVNATAYMGDDYKWFLE